MREKLRTQTEKRSVSGDDITRDISQPSKYKKSINGTEIEGCSCRLVKVTNTEKFANERNDGERSNASQPNSLDNIYQDLLPSATL